MLKGEDLGRRGGGEDLEEQKTTIGTYCIGKIYFQLRKQCLKNYSIIVPGE